MRGPCGGFEYKSNAVQHISLISSGIGSTPLIQILRCIMADTADKTSVTYVNFAEKKEDIIYKKEIDDFRDKDERLNVFFTLNDCDDSWEGGEGYIDSEMLEKNMPKAGSKTHKIILCGGPAMVVSCLEFLRQQGFPSEDVFVYGHFGVEQMRSIYGKRTKLSTHTLA